MGSRGNDTSSAGAIAGARAPGDDAYRLLAENSTDLIMRHDQEGICLYASPAAREILGYEPEEVVGTSGYRFFHPDDLERIAALAEHLEGEEPEDDVHTLTVRIIRRDGSTIWTETTLRTFRDTAGEVVEVQSSTRDVTDRIEAERRLRRSEELHRRIAQNLPNTGIFVYDRDLRLIYAEGNVANQLGWFSDEEFEGLDFEAMLEAAPPEIGELLVEHYPKVLGGEERGFEVETEGMTFVVRCVPMSSEDGSEVEGVLTVAHDETERKRNSRALEENARRERATAHLGQIALRERELERLFSVAVQTIADTLGVELSGVLEHAGDPPRFVIRSHVGLPEGTHSIPLDPRGQAGYTLRSKAPVVVRDLQRETRFLAPQGLIEQGVRSGISVPIDGPEEPFGILSAHTTRSREFSDQEVDFLRTMANILSAAVSRHNDEQASRHAALHDPLTGLPNRVLALDRLQLGIERRRRTGSDVAVLMLDLDRFKNINDSLGHEAGDELLLSLAPRLREAVRAEDTVARLGGDEFAIVCSGLDGARDAVRIAEKVIAAVARPFMLESAQRYVTGSVGIAVASRATDSAESLMRDADVAMYRAKSAGPGRYELFDDRMRSRVMNRLRIESELRTAIDRGELQVHYQPVVDIRTLEVEALEGLVRWHHPRHGLCGPDQFIDIAEETGLIVELGEWVLAEACRQVASWQRRRERRLSVSVNVSSRQLTGPAFGHRVREIAERSGLEPGTLALELTESALISESEAPQDLIRGLRAHGLKLLLDDFGTGYSSLSYLKRFDLDGLKIDRAFVDGLGTDESDTGIVEAIIGMANALGLRVVAEGVETTRQLDLLRDLGCQRGQGYLFSRPLPPGRVDHFLAAEGARAAVNAVSPSGARA